MDPAIVAEQYEESKRCQEVKTGRTSTYHVTKEDLEAKIDSVEYHKFGGTCSAHTVCAITTVNGFVVIGESACADPANYNQEIGQTLAYHRAFDKLWPLEGYLLREVMRIEHELGVNTEKETQ